MTIGIWSPDPGFGYCPETGTPCATCNGRCSRSEERKMREQVVIDNKMRKAAAEEAARKLMQPPVEHVTVTILRQINGSLQAILGELREMKKPIPIFGTYAVENGKLVGKPSRKTSVSQKIAMKNSKKVRVTKRTAGSQRP